MITAAFIVFNRQWLYDFYREKTYQPTSEMQTIRDSLKLTDQGKFLFNASHPGLYSEEEFNNNCQSLSDETAVLGCYTRQNIYVYNITEKRLAGIRELTTAHELLHAVYARMSSDEKDALRPDLEKVYRENQSTLKKEIGSYSSDQQLEEIYVRAGTEIKKLPASLEQHFAKIFQDQDKIVNFYNSYIAVFRQLESELDTLKNEMENLNSTINQKTKAYESAVSQLNNEVNEFNNCANTVDCFSSEYEFNLRRNELVAKQNYLDTLYYEIDSLISQYNKYVEKYNNNVLESNNLQNIVNSHVKVKGIK